MMDNMGLKDVMKIFEKFGLNDSIGLDESIKIFKEMMDKDNNELNEIIGKIKSMISEDNKELNKVIEIVEGVVPNLSLEKTDGGWMLIFMLLIILGNSLNIQLIKNLIIYNGVLIV